LDLMALSDTHSRTPLVEGSVRRRDLFLTNTQRPQQMDIHVLRRGSNLQSQ